MDAPTVFIESRTKPICEVPCMISGNRPADGGHLILSKEEMDELIKVEPFSQNFIKRFMMGK